MSPAQITLQHHDTVLEVRLDRPDRRNALSRALLNELRDVFDELPSTTRAVVLTSSGPAFTAGADFADLTGTASDLDFDNDHADACRAIRACATPVIAAIDGACVGAGVDLAVSCDLRVAGPAGWFRVPAVELGLLYNPTSIRRLHATLPRATVTRLLVLAERFDATEAVVGGLATHQATENARDSALGLALTLAGSPADAVNATRALLADLDEGTYSEQDWQRTRIELLNSPARQNAVAAAQQRHLGAQRTAAQTGTRT